MKLTNIINHQGQALTKVLETLKKEFNVTLNLDSTKSMQLAEQAALNAIKKIKLTEGFNSHHKQPAFVCAQLILEAVKLGKKTKPTKKVAKKKKINEANEIDKAELLLASKSIVDDLQKMIENLSKTQITQLPPIVDRIKVQYGYGTAAQYREQASSQLQAAIASLGTAKESIDDLTMKLSGDVDMAGDFETPLSVPAVDDGEEYNDAPAVNANKLEPKMPEQPSERERKDEYSESRISKKKSLSEDVVDFPSYKIKPSTKTSSEPAKIYDFEDEQMMHQQEKYSDIMDEVYKAVIKPVVDTGRLVDWALVRKYAIRKYGSQIKKLQGIDNLINHLKDDVEAGGDLSVNESFDTKPDPDHEVDLLANYNKIEHAIMQDLAQSIRSVHPVNMDAVKKMILRKYAHHLPSAGADINMIMHNISAILQNEYDKEIIPVHETVHEAWDVKMKTKPSEKGKWDGWTKADLEKKLASLKKKKDHSAEDTKTIKQIDFALRAKGKGKKHTDKWGKVNESVDETVTLSVKTAKGKIGKKTFKNKEDAKAWLSTNGHHLSEISFEDKKDAIAENNKPIVTKIGMSGMHRIGTLPKDISEVELAEYFGPSQEGDPDKVTAEWAFKVDGVPVGIWDYKGNRWSVGSTTADFEKVKEVLAKFGLEMTK